MNLVDTPKAIWGYWSVRAQVVFMGLSAALAAAWGIAELYPDVMARWATYLGLPAETPQTLTKDLLVASLILNAITPPITIMLRALKQGKTYDDAADDPQDVP